MDLKKIGKEILGKLPVFIFCVLFINGYNSICGKENSIVGVVLLMGLLILMKDDLGFNAKVASALIPILFITMGFGAKLSLINPFLGIIINGVVLTFLIMISGHDSLKTSYLPFMMGYIMLQGYDVDGTLFFKRWASLLIGGIVIGLVYYLLHRNKEESWKLQDIMGINSLGIVEKQWHIKLVVTLVIVMFIGDVLDFSKTMWINLTILSLLTPMLDDHRERRKYRLPATIIGCVLFFALFEVLIPYQYQMMVMLLAGFISMFITSYFIKTIYNSFSALVTAVLLFPAKDAVFIRILANAIGIVIALISNTLFNKYFSTDN